MRTIINGVNVKQFIKGWWGEHGDGNKLLSELSLPLDTFPFSVESFLKHRRTSFKDGNGHTVAVWFKGDDNKFEFSRSCQGKNRSIKLFREWGAENLDSIIEFESYSIGECVRKIILGKSIV